MGPLFPVVNDIKQSRKNEDSDHASLPPKEKKFRPNKLHFVLTFRRETSYWVSKHPLFSKNKDLEYEKEKKKWQNNHKMYWISNFYISWIKYTWGGEKRKEKNIQYSLIAHYHREKPKVQMEIMFSFNRYK